MHWGLISISFIGSSLEGDGTIGLGLGVDVGVGVCVLPFLLFFGTLLISLPLFLAYVDSEGYGTYATIVYMSLLNNLFLSTFSKFSDSNSIWKLITMYFFSLNKCHIWYNSLLFSIAPFFISRQCNFSDKHFKRSVISHKNLSY